jgi:hypothetical protein
MLSTRFGVETSKETGFSPVARPLENAKNAASLLTSGARVTLV